MVGSARVVVDGSNLCHVRVPQLPQDVWVRSRVERLEQAMRQINSLLDSPAHLKVYVDATLPYQIHHSEQHRLAALIESGQCSQCPAGVRADSLILKWAQDHDALVVSGDRFQQYADRYPFVWHRARMFAPEYDEERRLWLFFEKNASKKASARFIEEVVRQRHHTPPLPSIRCLCQALLRPPASHRGASRIRCPRCKTLHVLGA